MTPEQLIALVLVIADQRIQIEALRVEVAQLKQEQVDSNGRDAEYAEVD